MSLLVSIFWDFNKKVLLNADDDHKVTNKRSMSGGLLSDFAQTSVIRFSTFSATLLAKKTLSHHKDSLICSKSALSLPIWDCTLCSFCLVSSHMFSFLL